MKQHDSDRDKGERRWTASGWKLRVTPGLVLWTVVAFVALVLLAQNGQDIQVDVFVWTVTAPLFVIIAAALVIGWGLGEVGTRVWRWRRRDR